MQPAPGSGCSRSQVRGSSGVLLPLYVAVRKALQEDACRPQQARSAGAAAVPEPVSLRPQVGGGPGGRAGERRQWAPAGSAEAFPHLRSPILQHMVLHPTRCCHRVLSRPCSSRSHCRHPWSSHWRQSGRGGRRLSARCSGQRSRSLPWSSAYSLSARRGRQLSSGLWSRSLPWSSGCSRSARGGKQLSVRCSRLRQWPPHQRTALVN